jgi:hypothetical protein
LIKKRVSLPVEKTFVYVCFVLLNDMKDRKVLKELGNTSISKGAKEIAKQTPRQLDPKNDLSYDGHLSTLVEDLKKECETLDSSFKNVRGFASHGAPQKMIIIALFS